MELTGWTVYINNCRYGVVSAHCVIAPPPHCSLPSLCARVPGELLVTGVHSKLVQQLSEDLFPDAVAETAQPVLSPASAERAASSTERVQLTGSASAHHIGALQRSACEWNASAGVLQDLSQLPPVYTIAAWLMCFHPVVTHTPCCELSQAH